MAQNIISEEKYVEDESTCCFCGEPLECWGPGAYGNNPAPADIRPGKRCCCRCDARIVIPARMFIADLVRGAK